MAIKTDVGQRQAVRVNQAQMQSPVMAPKYQADTRGAELAKALGVLGQDAVGIFAKENKERDLEDAQRARNEFHGLSENDKALVIGLPVYQQQSAAFRQTLSGLLATHKANGATQTLAKEIEQGMHQTAEAVKARGLELRDEALAGIEDPDLISGYDAEYNKSAQRFEMIGATVDGKNLLAGARKVFGETLNGVLITEGPDAAYRMFHEKHKDIGVPRTEANSHIMGAVKNAMSNPNIPTAAKNKLLDMMRDKQLTGEKGEKLGTFGEISGYGAELVQLRDYANNLGLKAAVGRTEQFSIEMDTLVASGDVTAVIAKAKEIENDEDPSVGEWAKPRLSEWVKAATNAAEVKRKAHEAEFVANQVKLATTQAVEADYAALRNSKVPMGSLLAQPVDIQVSYMGENGKLVNKTVTISPTERRAALEQFAAQQSLREHSSNKDETNAQWAMRDYEVWGVHGMMPPHHAENVKVGVNGLKFTNDKTADASPEGEQVLRMFQLLKDRPEIAREVFKDNLTYIEDVESLAYGDGMGSKNAAAAVNKVAELQKDKMFITQVTDLKAEVYEQKDGWFGDQIKNGHKLGKEVERLISVGLAAGKRPEDAMAYAQSRIAEMPIIHGSRIRKDVAAKIVTARDSSPGELVQNYLEESFKNNPLLLETLEDATIQEVRTNGVVTGFQFTGNAKKTGWATMTWFSDRGTTPLGPMRNADGSVIEISIDALNKYGQRANTEYTKNVQKRRSRIIPFTDITREDLQFGPKNTFLTPERQEAATKAMQRARQR